MPYLDAYVPHIHKSSGSIAISTETMQAIMQLAEQQAHAASAFNKGEHAAAFQLAHARFMESTNKIRELLHQASEQLQISATTYTSTDSAAAHTMSQVIAE